MRDGELVGEDGRPFPRREGAARWKIYAGSGWTVKVAVASCLLSSAPSPPICPPSQRLPAESNVSNESRS